MIEKKSRAKISNRTKLIALVWHSTDRHSQGTRFPMSSFLCCFSFYICAALFLLREFLCRRFCKICSLCGIYLSYLTAFLMICRVSIRYLDSLMVDGDGRCPYIANTYKDLTSSYDYYCRDQASHQHGA